MSTPAPESNAPSDPPLVEPEPTRSIPVDPESLDTQRILRETSAIPVVSDPHTPHVAPPPEEATPGVNPPAKLNALAVVAMILALAVSPFAVVFGYVAVGQIRRAGQRGERLAWTAVGLGWLWVVGYVVAGSVFAVLWLDIS